MMTKEKEPNDALTTVPSSTPWVLTDKVGS